MANWSRRSSPDNRVMRERDSFDGALKDVFQWDRPTVLGRFAHAAVKRFLNVEVTKVLERRSDLILYLADGTILHIEFQSINDRDMPYRMAIYWALIKLAFRRPVRQLVLYVGSRPLSMTSPLREDGMGLEYDVIDIREIDAAALMESGNLETSRWRFWPAAGIGCFRRS